MAGKKIPVVTVDGDSGHVHHGAQYEWLIPPDAVDGGVLTSDSTQPSGVRVANGGSQTYIATGVADTAGILAAFNAMKADGTHAVGELIVKGVAALDAQLVLDGGYSNVGGASLNAGDTPQFRLRVLGALVPAATLGQALIVRGFYNPEIDVRFQGGGTRRTVTDAAITSATATLTSATAAFSAADVGSVVRVNGAGDAVAATSTIAGSNDLWATIKSVESATSCTLSANAGTTVSGASAGILTVGLHVGNIDGGVIKVRGTAYAGTLYHADKNAVTNEGLKLTRTEECWAEGCGQMLMFREIKGAGLQPMGSLVDTGCVEGSVFINTDDLTINSYELSAVATMRDGVTVEGCNSWHALVMDLGSGSGNPANALLKWSKNAGNSSDANTIDILRVGAALVASNPVIDGAQFIDTSSLRINNMESKNCLKALHVVGSKVNVGYHHSLTKDQQAIYIEGSTFNLAPEVRIGDGYWRNVLNQIAYVNANATGAGRLDIAGYIDTPNQAGAGSMATIDVQGTAFKLNVAGLKQLHRNTLALGSINHVTAGLTTGLPASNLTNTPMKVLANPATQTLVSGTAVQNDPNANNGMTMLIAVGIAWSAGAGTVTVAVGSDSAGVVSLQQISKGASGLAENDLYGPFFLPPDWWIKVTLTGTAAFGTNHKWFI